MHSAWIRKESDGNVSWRRTNRIEEVIDCSEPMIVCNDETETEFVADTISAREGGKFVYNGHWQITVSDVPIFADLAAAEATIKAGHRVRLVNLGSHWGTARLGGVFYRFKENKEWDIQKQETVTVPRNEGIVVVGEEKGKCQAFFDIALWHRLVRVAKRAEMKRDRERSLDRYAVASVVYALCASIGFSYPGNFKLEHTYAWICAHDGVRGRRKTNSLIRDLAKRWAKDRVRIRKRWKQYMGLENLNALERRFRAIVDLPEIVEEKEKLNAA